MSLQHSSSSVFSYRMKVGLIRATLGTNLGVSIGTIKNWERGWTGPHSRFGELFIR